MNSQVKKYRIFKGDYPNWSLKKDLEILTPRLSTGWMKLKSSNSPLCIWVKDEDCEEVVEEKKKVAKTTPQLNNLPKYEDIPKLPKEPLIELIPREVHDRERLRLISIAISQYTEKELTIENVWVQEYNELVTKLNKPKDGTRGN